MSNLARVLVLACAIPLVALLPAAAWWIRHRWVVIRVEGVSMLPALRDGDVILVSRSPRTVIARGDIVVFWGPDLLGQPRPSFPAGSGTGRLVIKRVVATPGDRVPEIVRHWAPVATVPDNSLVVYGDNGGLDSRAFGLLPRDRVVGVFARPLARSCERRRPAGGVAAPPT